LSAKLQIESSQPASSRNLFASIDLAFGNSFRLQFEMTQSPGITILFGASGAGKTTILECLAGLARPDRGRIVAGEITLFDSDQGVNVAPQRRRCGYLFQTLALFPHMTVQDNVEYGLAGLPNSERRSRSGAILESFRIASLAHRKPGMISGGERQRVALARSLVTDPAFLLLDEPLSGLDAATKGRIVDDLRAWNRDHNIPILYVTHDRNEAFGLGDRVLVLESGHVVAEGTPHEVLDSPRRETVAQLVGFENVFDAVVQSQHEHDGTMTCLLRPSTSHRAPHPPQSADVGSDRTDRKALEKFFVESGIGGRKPLPPSQAPAPQVALEVPLSRVEAGQELHIGIRAGDIMISVERPTGLSARNLISAEILSITRQAATAILETAAAEHRAIHFIVHLTPRAVESLKLSVGDGIWLVLKTHSCHVMKKEA
jgi:ABC-type molybdate transport system ATPase subunit